MEMLVIVAKRKGTIARYKLILNMFVQILVVPKTDVFSSCSFLEGLWKMTTQFNSFCKF